VDGALRAYQVSQVNDSDAPVPYFNAGVAYLQGGEYQRAEAALQQALRTADETILADVYFALGEAYFRQGAFQRAVAAYRQVLLQRPDDEDARYNLQLALLSIPTPTTTLSPTPTIESTDDTQNITSTPTRTSTPTPDSPDDPTQPPTPSPQANTDNSTQQPTPEGENNDQQPPPMDEEAALELLDDVQQGQGVLFSPLSQVEGDNAVIERDW
jgi:tetratricopeptide (TPR) repeat protein